MALHCSDRDRISFRPTGLARPFQIEGVSGLGHHLRISVKRVPKVALAARARLFRRLVADGCRIRFGGHEDRHQPTSQIGKHRHCWKRHIHTANPREVGTLCDGELPGLKTNLICHHIGG